MSSLELLKNIDLSFLITTMLVILGIIFVLWIMTHSTTLNIHSHFLSRFNNGEKRRESRMPCNYIMDVWNARNQVLVAQARVLNLSTDGAQMACMARLNSGDEIIGRVLQTEQGDIRVRGRVVWKRMSTVSPLYGIRFTSHR